MRSLIDRLRDRCKTNIDGCWEWQGAFDGKGIPAVQILSLNKSSMSVRRLIYLIAVGPISKGRVVLPDCENRKCVNPAHLKLTDKAGLNRLICQTRKPRAVKIEQGAWHP